MRFDTLSQWLEWQENLHFTKVDPGLDRVGYVWQKMGGKIKLPFTVITVAGTNGKGSSVAILESILRAAGYRTGTYTSPHLLRYNERICIDHIPCDDDTICEAFNRIDNAREDTSITYFEFATLAAVDIFSRQKIDIAILEVGMGGRLDAVNLFDTDIALITPIGIDHTAWLGESREKIAFEKAGIIRAGKPVVCSEDTPAKSLVDHAKSLEAPIYQAEVDFKAVKEPDRWHWSNNTEHWQDLPLPALIGSYQIQNSAAVLQVISLLHQKDFSISEQNIRTGLANVELAGRFQRLLGDVERIFDVTHNHLGAENLAVLLVETACNGRTLAVLGILKDKDITAVTSALGLSIDSWYVAGLDGARGITGDDLAVQIVNVLENSDVKPHITVIDAYQHAMKDAQIGDRILIFGSFLTVEAVMKTISNELI